MLLVVWIKRWCFRGWLGPVRWWWPSEKVHVCL